MKTIKDYITGHMFSGKKVTVKSQQNDCIDLDLPSGTLWATCNIGAKKPEDDGLLFQIGRVDGYKYGDKNHNFLSEDDYVTTSGKKYKAGDILKPEDDAAYQSTKGRLRMPTDDEINELIEHTNNEWTELNGVNGRKFISKRDDSKWIFIPAAGYFSCYNGEFSDSGSDGYIWGSSINVKAGYPNSANYFYFDNCKCARSGNLCMFGRSVRGVLNK